MANKTNERKWSKKNTIDGSAVLDMEIMDDDEADISQSGDTYQRKKTDSAGPADHADSGAGGTLFGDKLRGNVTSLVWQTGKERAQKAWNIYANIDILRPYFDVEPQEVCNRLLQSLIPQKSSGDNFPPKMHRELYGPLMLVFTLIALLLFQMKSSGHTVQEGTLMGTAFGVCFGYWLGISSLLWFLSYICNTHVKMVQILSLLGYGLFGHCVVLFFTTMIHTTHDHLYFYVMWALFGGAATLKMVTVLTSRTTGQTQRLILGGTIVTIHMLFLIYLHFAYHQIVEEISAAMEGPAVPAPVAHPDHPLGGGDSPVVGNNANVGGDALLNVQKRVAKDLVTKASNVVSAIAAKAPQMMQKLADKAHSVD